MYRTKYFVLIIVATLVWVTGWTQEDKPETVIINNDTVIVQAIPLSEIPQKTEDAYNQLKETSQIIESYNDQRSVDSLIRVGNKYIQEEIQKIEATKNTMSTRELEDEKKKWKNNSNLLNGWRTKFNNRTLTLEKQKRRITLLLKQWNLTLQEAEDQNALPEIVNNIKNILHEIKDVDKKLTIKQNQLYMNQNQVTEFILTVDKIRNELEEVSLSSFNQDAPPIWETKDSISSNQIARNLVLKYTQESSKNLRLFQKDYSRNIILQILVFLVLIALLYLLGHEKKKPDDENNAAIQDRSFFITHFILTAFFLTTIASVWIYPFRPSIVNDILRIVVIFTGFVLLYKLYGRKFIKITVLLFILLLFKEVSVFFIRSWLLARIYLYIHLLYTGLVLYYLILTIRSMLPDLRFNLKGILYFFTGLFYIFLGVALAGNTFGFVNLATSMVSTVNNAIFTSIIYILIAMALDDIVSALFDTKFVQQSNILKERKNTLVPQLTKLIYIVLTLLWIDSIIKSLGYSNLLENWLSSLMDSNWVVGTSTISLGAIISVILIIVITALVVRFVNIFYEKELFPRIRLPRGVPGAVSMITRYIIVAFGIYFVLAAAGIDLSKFGLIAGALGVGIGFGLQNVVFNFIAGLILAFERPFQVGDVIELNQLMGTVTSIGVRSSKIRTYDGSEVIVPNGNLISNDLINWTLSDRKKRREINVGVAYGTDPHEVIEILKRVASEHKDVLDSPAPWPTFEGFGESSLDFKIRFWVALDIGMTVKSQVALGIYDALKEAGIEIPFPQQDVYIKSLENNALKTEKPDQKSRKPKKSASQRNKDITDTQKDAEQIEPDSDDT